MRVDLKGCCQVSSCFVRVSGLGGDHSAVIEQKCVARAELKGLLAGPVSFVVFAIFIKDPCEYVPCVDVLSNI